MAHSNVFGNRRTLVSIQSATPSKDSLGHITKTWSTVATYWCLKRQLSGRELLNAAQQKVVADFLLETWYDSGFALTVLHRVVIGSSTYGISRIDDVDDRHETWHIYCSLIALAPES